MGKGFGGLSSLSLCRNILKLDNREPRAGQEGRETPKYAEEAARPRQPGFHTFIVKL